MSMDPETVGKKHANQKGRTLFEPDQQDDRTWITTQIDIEIEGTGETEALAAMDYCRRVVEQG